MAQSFFNKGMEVEACSDESGFRGAWFEAIIVRSVSKKNNKAQVEYKTLMADEKGTKPLREFINVVNLRPPPPRELHPTFQSSDLVDAFHNDAWWEGVVTKVLEETGKYVVYFRPSKEQIEFGPGDLRVHREWVDGSWVPPMEGNAEVEAAQQENEEEKNPKKKKQKQNDSAGLEIDQSKTPSKLEVKFEEGMHVEVTSDEEGFVGAWFTARIIKAVGKSKYLVEYKTLKTEDERELLQEEVDALDIRPPPPELPQIERFRLLDEVDAMYNDGWWVGVVSKVKESRYYVYFKVTEEELEFAHSQLRIHQEWIDGKWSTPSQALM